MKSLTAVIKDLNRQIKNERLRTLAIIGAILIGMLFGLLSVYAFWNPAGAMKELDVPVVILDKGTTIDGKFENFGDEIADNIKDNDKVNWIVTHEDIFRNGIENTDYYFGFVIPEDFSQRIKDAKNDPRDKPFIAFTGDTRKNFLMSQMSGTVRNAFAEIIAGSISEEYAISLVDGLLDASEGMKDAAEGSSKLGDGLDSASQGAEQLKSGSDQLESGLETLSEGNTRLSKSTTSLAEGTDSLEAGLQKLETNVESLSSGIGSMKEGSGQLAGGAETVSAGASRLAESADEFSKGVDAVSEAAIKSTEEYTANANVYIDGYAALYEMVSQSPSWQMIPEEQKAILEKLYAGSDSMKNAGDNLQHGLENGFTELTTGAKGLKEGVDQLREGAEGVTSGAKTLEEKLEKADDASEKIYQGAVSLFSAGKKLNQGASKIVDGAKSASAGTDKILSGAEKLADGAGTLSAGMDEIQTGTETLTDALEDGGARIEEGVGKDPEGLAAFVSDPLDTEMNIYGDTDRYGLGLAPLFLSLGLWIGSLILFFAIPLVPAVSVGAGRFASVFGSYLTFLMYDIIVAACIGAGGIFLVGIEPKSAAVFFLWAVFCAATFLAILFMLHRLLGELPGKAAGILFIVFQIAAAGGAISPDLIPGWLQIVSRILPMRYSIDGFREVIFGGQFTNLVTDIIPLVIWFGCSILLSLAAKRRSETS